MPPRRARRRSGRLRGRRSRRSQQRTERADVSCVRESFRCSCSWGWAPLVSWGWDLLGFSRFEVERRLDDTLIGDGGPSCGLSYVVGRGGLDEDEAGLV